MIVELRFVIKTLTHQLSSREVFVVFRYNKNQIGN